MVASVMTYLSQYHQSKPRLNHHRRHRFKEFRIEDSMTVEESRRVDMFDEEPEGESERDGLVGNSTIRRRSDMWTKLRRTTTAVSIFLNILLFLVIIYLLTERKLAKSSYETGFDSDLGAIKPEIGLTQYSYSGGVQLNDDGEFMTDDSDKKKYVGHPTPEVDQAWRDLMLGLNIDLDSAEIGSSPDTFQWPESGLYFSGLEVYHSLHCLNRLRQALYPEYYNIFNDPHDPSREDHIGHCINHLRQAIQCHADLTPMTWSLAGNKIILDTSAQHTCRDFDRIHQWATQRTTRWEDYELIRNKTLVVVD
ncbi:hypothetical protein F4778DRAFT_732459 [Xylariomycetidae sp. FL2044]|nr:hypothetical protein F4778DRAFT_732459 [Xylariomycetidae sp. FL2044]